MNILDIIPDDSAAPVAGEINFHSATGWPATAKRVRLRTVDVFDGPDLEITFGDGALGFGALIPGAAGAHDNGEATRPWRNFFGKELRLEHVDGEINYLRFQYGLPGGTKVPYHIRFPDGPPPDAAGYVLKFDENAIATWAVNAGGGGGPAGGDNEIQYGLAGAFAASSKLKFFPALGSDISFNLSNSAGATNLVVDAADASSSALYLRRTSDIAGWLIYRPGGTLDLRFNAQGAGGGDRVWLTSAGSLGIGLTPTEKLHVSGNIKLTGSITFDGTQDPVISNQSAGSDFILQMNSRLRPASNLAYNIGEAVLRWDSIFARRIQLNNTSAEDVGINLQVGSGAGPSIGVLRTNSGSNVHLITSATAANHGLWVNDLRVVGARQTGWGAPTGTATRTTFATSTVTLEQLAQRVKALVDDFMAHGSIGA